MSQLFLAFGHCFNDIGSFTVSGPARGACASAALALRGQLLSSAHEELFHDSFVQVRVDVHQPSMRVVE